MNELILKSHSTHCVTSVIYHMFAGCVVHLQHMVHTHTHTHTHKHTHTHTHTHTVLSNLKGVVFVFAFVWQVCKSGYTQTHLMMQVKINLSLFVLQYSTNAVFVM